MRKKMNFLALFVPRFHKVDLAAIRSDEGSIENYQILCPVEIVEDFEYYDTIVHCKSFEFLGFGFTYRVIGETHL